MSSYSLLSPLLHKLGAIMPPDAAGRNARDPAEMARILRQERDRTDRTGLPFAMIVFDAPDCLQQRDVHETLAYVLARRLRISDEFGHLDRHRLAAILPATTSAGAWTVADDISLQFPADLPLPDCEVFVYPADTGESKCDRIAPSDSNTAKGEKAAAGVSDPREHRGRDGAVSAAASSLYASHSLAPLFFRPLPCWKRLIDIIVSALALVLLSPILAAAAIAIKATSPGPVLFRQMRSGLGGRPFVFYKFRSMVPDAEARKAGLMSLNEQDGPAFKIRRDPRITTIGRFLRKTSLDELPQLWNVLRGDMSLVGPRPLPCNESDACTGWHSRRLEVTPGLTCIWQVEGRSQVSFDDWVRMDIRYMRMRSLMKDFALILRTLPAMLLRKGV